MYVFELYHEVIGDSQFYNNYTAPPLWYMEMCAVTWM